MARSIHEQLSKYLTDAHAIEEQSLQQLRRAPDHAGEAGLAEALRGHVAETEGHRSRIRDLLEARGESPTRTKDVIMRAGGEGFVLFARSQPDTPGKLAAHALSYEALEWASYDLLAHTADHAGEPAVAAAAREIRDEERAMMERIEALFDATVTASLEGATGDDLRDRLATYLADAHALEAQSIQLLQSGREMVDDAPDLFRVMDEHLEESRAQQERLERRLEALGADPSRLKDAALQAAALNWGTFFLGHPDTAGKLAAFSYAFEHLEIGGYEQLRRVAQRAGDDATASLADDILAQERTAAGKLAGQFDQAVRVALAEQDVR